MMKKTFSLILFALLWVGCSPHTISHDPLQMMDQHRIALNNLKRHVAFLASDELNGRSSGTTEGRMAETYIATQFELMGLEPLFGTSFYQNIGFQEGLAHNIGGILEGSDPLLKDEYILIGAHHDHLPPRSFGIDRIFNGADDNASGVALVLELARVLLNQQVRFKRSLIFLTFAAEEQNKRGSTYFVSHPPQPIHAYKAMINLDMVGRNPDKPVRISGLGTSLAWRDIVKCGLQNKHMNVILAEPFTGYLDGGTDSEIFGKQHIPVLNFFTGYHQDYHKTSDHAETLSYSRMQLIGETVLDILDCLNQTETIDVHPLQQQ